MENSVRDGIGRVRGSGGLKGKGSLVKLRRIADIWKGGALRQ